MSGKRMKKRPKQKKKERQVKAGSGNDAVEAGEAGLAAGALSGMVPSDLRGRIEEARLDARAFLRSLDRLGFTQKKAGSSEIRSLVQADSDLAEALANLDRPSTGFNTKRFVRDVEAFISRIAAGQKRFLSREGRESRLALIEAIPSVLAGLYTDEAYLGVPGKDPVERSKPIDVDPETMERLRQLPATEEEWIGGRGFLSAEVEGQDNVAYRPDVAVWIDADTRDILGYELLHPDDGDDKLLFLLFETMQNPRTGKPRLPAKLELSELRLARSMGPALAGLGIEPMPGRGRMLVEPIEQIEASLRDGQDHLSAPRSCIVEGPVLAEDVSRFFQAAARLFRETPWDDIRPEHVMDVRIGRWGVDHLVVTISSVGGKGLTTFDSLDDLITCSQRLEAQIFRTEMSPIPIPTRAVEFYDKRELINIIIQEAVREGWEVADPKAFPMVTRQDEKGEKMDLTREDYWVLTALAECVADLFSQRPEIFDEDGPDEVTETYVSRFWPDLEMQITVPHPEL